MPDARSLSAALRVLLRFLPTSSLTLPHHQPPKEPRPMYWYTWVILIGVVAAITIFGIISSLLSGFHRGWRTLVQEFPMDEAPEINAFKGRSTMFIYAAGEAPKRYGCLAFLMPWTWKFPHSVRFVSDSRALYIMLDAGKLAPSSGARIPFSELYLINQFTMKLAYTFWGGQFGDHALLKAGSTTLTVPADQFQNEIALLQDMGQTTTHPEDPNDWSDHGTDPNQDPQPDPWNDDPNQPSQSKPAKDDRNKKPPNWDDFRQP